MPQTLNPGYLSEHPVDSVQIFSALLRSVHSVRGSARDSFKGHQSYPCHSDSQKPPKSIFVSLWESRFQALAARVGLEKFVCSAALGFLLWRKGFQIYGADFGNVGSRC